MRYTIRQELFDDKGCDLMDLGLLHRVISPDVVEQVLSDCAAKEERKLNMLSLRFLAPGRLRLASHSARPRGSRLHKGLLLGCLTLCLLSPSTIGEQAHLCRADLRSTQATEHYEAVQTRAFV